MIMAPERYGSSDDFTPENLLGTPMARDAYEDELKHAKDLWLKYLQAEEDQVLDELIAGAVPEASWLRSTLTREREEGGLPEANLTFVRVAIDTEPQNVRGLMPVQIDRIKNTGEIATLVAAARVARYYEPVGEGAPDHALVAQREMEVLELPGTARLLFEGMLAQLD